MIIWIRGRDCLETLFSTFFDLLVNKCLNNNIESIANILCLFILGDILLAFYFIINYALNKKYMRLPHDQKVNNQALNKLYGPLYIYVYSLNDLENYSPEEASIFLTTVKDIIKKNPYFSTPYLDQHIALLEQSLQHENPNYVQDLICIQSHIMTLYYSIRNKLNYPKSSVINNIFTSSPAFRSFIVAYFLNLLGLITYLISWIVLNKFSTSFYCQVICVSLIFAFFVSSIGMIIRTIILAIKEYIKKRKIKKKWFSTTENHKKKIIKTNKK